MASNLWSNPGTVLQISIKKCDHSTEKNLFVSVANSLSMLEIFERYHGLVDFLLYEISIATETKKADNTKSTFEIQSSLTVADLIARFEIKNLVFSCKRKEATRCQDVGIGQRDYNAGKKQINAFDKLMAPKRELPPRKQSRWVKYIMQSKQYCLGNCF